MTSALYNPESFLLLFGEVYYASRRRQWHCTPVLLPGKIPWIEEPGGLQSMGLLRVGHNWVTSLSLFTFMHWRRKWQPTPVYLPGESQGQRSLVGCRLWGHRVGHNWSNLACRYNHIISPSNTKKIYFNTNFPQIPNSHSIKFWRKKFFFYVCWFLNHLCLSFSLLLAMFKDI